MMESALSYLTVLPGTLTERQQFFKKIKDELLSEESDPLLALRQIKSTAKLFESILKDKEIDYLFIKEAEKHSKDFDHLEVNFRIQETGVKYHFKDCGDPQWDAIVDQIAELEEARKKREQTLKFLPEEGIWDEDTGAQITRAPKTSKTSVVVTV